MSEVDIEMLALYLISLIHLQIYLESVKRIPLLLKTFLALPDFEGLYFCFKLAGINKSQSSHYPQ